MIIFCGNINDRINFTNLSIYNKGDHFDISGSTCIDLYDNLKIKVGYEDRQMIGNVIFNHQDYIGSVGYSKPKIVYYVPNLQFSLLHNMFKNTQARPWIGGCWKNLSLGLIDLRHLGSGHITPALLIAAITGTYKIFNFQIGCLNNFFVIAQIWNCIAIRGDLQQGLWFALCPSKIAQKLFGNTKLINTIDMIIKLYIIAKMTAIIFHIILFLKLHVKIEYDNGWNFSFSLLNIPTNRYRSISLQGV